MIGNSSAHRVNHWHIKIIKVQRNHHDILKANNHSVFAKKGTRNPFALMVQMCHIVPPSPFPQTINCQSCGEGGLDEEPDLAFNIEIHVAKPFMLWLSDPELGLS